MVCLVCLDYNVLQFRLGVLCSQIHVPHVVAALWTFEKSAEVMIVDEMVSPFSRIWCLFEVKRLTDLQKDPPGDVGLLGP